MKWQPARALPRPERRLRVGTRCKRCRRRALHILRERERIEARAFYLVCTECSCVRLLSQQLERVA
jgi:hypothetical protein